MKKVYKKVLLFLFVLILMLAIKNNIYAASVNISVGSGTITLGESCTITITGTGAAAYDVVANISGAGISDKIYLNAYTDNLQNGTKSASKTIKPTKTGKITVSIANSSNITISGASGSTPISGASKTITVNEKVSTTETPTNTPTTPKPTTTTKKPTTSKPTTTTTPTKQEEPKVVEDNFYINSILLKGIKENGETENITLSPEFNKDIYEYTCNVSAQINKIEIEKEAGQYTNSIIVKGLEKLKVGENIITLMLSAEDHQAKTYTIKVIKEETVEASADIAEEKIQEDREQKEPAMIHMPVWAFIALQMGIIVVEVITILFIIKQTKARH